VQPDGGSDKDCSFGWQRYNILPSFARLLQNTFDNSDKSIIFASK
jgi:hypothetical protein